jgi:hypothetical protein
MDLKMGVNGEGYLAAMKGKSTLEHPEIFLTRHCLSSTSDRPQEDRVVFRLPVLINWPIFYNEGVCTISIINRLRNVVEWPDQSWIFQSIKAILRDEKTTIKALEEQQRICSAGRCVLYRNHSCLDTSLIIPPSRYGRRASNIISSFINCLWPDKPKGPLWGSGSKYKPFSQQQFLLNVLVPEVLCSLIHNIEGGDALTMAGRYQKLVETEEDADELSFDPEGEDPIIAHLEAAHKLNLGKSGLTPQDLVILLKYKL